MKNLSFNSLTDAFNEINKINNDANSGSFAVFRPVSGHYDVDIYYGYEVSKYARNQINQSLHNNLGRLYMNPFKLGRTFR